MAQSWRPKYLETVSLVSFFHVLVNACAVHMQCVYTWVFLLVFQKTAQHSILTLTQRSTSLDFPLCQEHDLIRPVLVWNPLIQKLVKHKKHQTLVYNARESFTIVGGRGHHFIILLNISETNRTTACTSLWLSRMLVNTLDCPVT